MILNEYRINHKSRSDRFWIYFFADIHLGNRACDKEKLKKHIFEVETNPHAYWIGGGDYIEAINYTDKRFDGSQIDPSYLNHLSNAAHEQTADIITLFKNIRHKCLGLHRGNHEECIRLKYHYDVMQEFKNCWPEVPLLEDTAFTRLVFHRTGNKIKKHYPGSVFIIWSAHGNIGGRKSGGKINRIEDAMAFFDADIYLMGHGHRKIITSLTALSTTNTKTMKLNARRRIGGMTGAYFKTYVEGASTYAEKAMFSPSDLGAIKVVIDPSDRNYDLCEV